MSSTENFDTSGLSEETKLVLEQAMKALTFKAAAVDPSTEPRVSRLSSLGKLSDYEAQSYRDSSGSPQEQPQARSALSPAILPKPAGLPQTRARPGVQNSNGSVFSPGPVFRKVDDLTADVDVSVSQLAAEGMVPGYRSTGQISVPRQSIPYNASRQAQAPSDELAAHLRQAVDKDIAAMVDQIKFRQQAPDSARGAVNLADPALTEEDKKLLYQEMYGYGSYPSSSIHSSRSASPSTARHRHDWHADFYNNRQELLGGDSVSGSEAGSLRGSYVDIPMTRSSEVDPLTFASNPVYSQNPSAIGAPHRMPMMAQRAAAPPPQRPNERKTYDEWSQQLNTRPLPPDETVVKLRYLDQQSVQPREAAPPQPGSGRSVVDVPEEFQNRGVVDVPDAMAQVLARRAEPPFNFSSTSSIPYTGQNLSAPAFNPQPSLLSSQRSLPAESAMRGSSPVNFAPQHTSSLLSSQRFTAEPPFNFIASGSAPMQLGAAIQVASPQRYGSFNTTGTSPVKPGSRSSLPGFNPGPPMYATSGIHSSQPSLSSQASLSALNHSFGSDGFAFSDVYHSSDGSRLRSSFGGTSFLSSSSLQPSVGSWGMASVPPPNVRDAAPPAPPPNVASMLQAPWRENAAPPSSVQATCTVGQSGAVAKLEWEAGPWQEAVFELQIMLLSVNDDWRTAYVGGDSSCTIPSLRLGSTFAVRVRASDAQSSSNFSPVVHFTTPSAPSAAASPAPGPTKTPAPAPAPAATRAAAPPPPAPAADAEVKPPSPPTETTAPKSPAVKSPQATPAAKMAIPKLPTENLTPGASADVRSPSPRVLAVTTAKQAPPPVAAPPVTPPAVRQTAQESSDVGDYVSFSEGGSSTSTTTYLANVLSPSYSVQWAGNQGVVGSGLGSAPLHSHAGVPMRTVTSAPYMGSAYGGRSTYGSLVTGGHSLVTPVENRVNYNTGADMYTRSPPPVTFQNSGAAQYPSSRFAGAPVVSSSTRVQPSSLRNTWA